MRAALATNLSRHLNGFGPRWRLATATTRTASKARILPSVLLCFKCAREGRRQRSDREKRGGARQLPPHPPSHACVGRLLTVRLQGCVFGYKLHTLVMVSKRLHPYSNRSSEAVLRLAAASPKTQSRSNSPERNVMSSFFVRGTMPTSLLSNAKIPLSLYGRLTSVK